MEHLGEMNMASEKSFMWNKRFRVQFGRITFGIHLIFLIILNPLVPPHFNNLVAILMKSLYFLFSTFVEVFENWQTSQHQWFYLCSYGCVVEQFDWV